MWPEISNDEFLIGMAPASLALLICIAVMIIYFEIKKKKMVLEDKKMKRKGPWWRRSQDTWL